MVYVSVQSVRIQFGNLTSDDSAHFGSDGRFVHVRYRREVHCEFCHFVTLLLKADRLYQRPRMIHSSLHGPAKSNASGSARTASNNSAPSDGSVNSIAEMKSRDVFAQLAKQLAAPKPRPGRGKSVRPACVECCKKEIAWAAKRCRPCSKKRQRGDSTFTSPTTHLPVETTLDFVDSRVGGARHDRRLLSWQKLRVAGLDCRRWAQARHAIGDSRGGRTSPLNRRVAARNRRREAALSAIWGRPRPD
jgi:hypothetical protein